MAFHVGQKVVCVDTWPPLSIWQRIVDSWHQWRHPFTHPVKGAIYTVAYIYVSQNSGRLCLELAELTDGQPCWAPGFYACGFRPVVDRKTDIGFAHEILRKVTKRQGADA